MWMLRECCQIHKEFDPVIQRRSGKYFFLKKLKKLSRNRAFLVKEKVLWTACTTTKNGHYYGSLLETFGKVCSLADQPNTCEKFILYFAVKINKMESKVKAINWPVFTVITRSIFCKIKNCTQMAEIISSRYRLLATDA